MLGRHRERDCRTVLEAGYRLLSAGARGGKRERYRSKTCVTVGKIRRSEAPWKRVREPCRAPWRSDPFQGQASCGVVKIKHFAVPDLIVSHGRKHFRKMFRQMFITILAALPLAVFCASEPTAAAVSTRAIVPSLALESGVP